MPLWTLTGETVGTALQDDCTNDSSQARYKLLLFHFCLAPLWHTLNALMKSRGLDEVLVTPGARVQVEVLA
jgi:hypothetical protein